MAKKKKPLAKLAVKKKKKAKGRMLVGEGFDHPILFSPYVIGQAYLIRTVTHYYTGHVAAVGSQELVLEDAAWIADTGRYADALKTGVLKEVEPIEGPCIVGRGAIVDVVPWKHALPREQK